MLNISNQRIDKKQIDTLPLKNLRELPTLRAGRRLGRWMLIVLAVGICTLFLPWRQNINGEGTVTALTPQDRPQTLQNAIAGRIEQWKVREGQFVQRNDTLLVISEIKDEYFDPKLPLRLKEQLQAKQGSLVATDAKITALDGQKTALENGLAVKLSAARNKVRQARFKVVSDSTDLIAIQNTYKIAQDRLQRYEKGHQSGLFSLTDLESRRLKVQEDYAKVIAQENKLNVTRQELLNAQLDLGTIQADYQEKLAKTQSDRSSAVSYRTEIDGEISKIVNKISSVEVRRGLYVIRAPQSGYVVRALKAGIGETIKEGESIATLQPDKPLVAVELYVRPNDVPLIQPGRHVRLEFDGWPAVQFSGWPNVAVGTFGGQVSVIDAVSSTNGKYRLLVEPKVSDKDPNWPRQLRVGSGVYGWVMLDNVPIWYEIWRKLNGFPPSLKAEPGSSGEGAKK
ncbi:HlyD family secretion protein [Larkinella terrae]|uniref:HlyD family efflux transporter periplasmic adaptor subunit n=1 Tax=Larkinella terrae TaxID=2025311 RepID=A0A7K0EQ98_9BACT|nr:HlyD family efflux transporter periplasmic adaptor subunit [Larkinella terrae]MRS64000.1 HlyD family efflux transporter periplasmic adaptor subunit [Larkinella terrae]